MYYAFVVILFHDTVECILHFAYFWLDHDLDQSRWLAVLTWLACCAADWLASQDVVGQDVV